MPVISLDSISSNATEVHGPGDYFISAIDGDRYFLMAGPYATHAEAASKVDAAKEIANQHDGRAWFMSWGTCRLPKDSGRTGSLNSNGLISRIQPNQPRCLQNPLL